MKTLLFFIPLILLNSLAFGALPNPGDIFGKNVPHGTATQDTYERLVCPLTQRKTAEYIFNRADTQGNGKLNFKEFQKAYEILGTVTWVPFPPEFVEMEFEQGDIVNKDNKIDLEEFTILCARLFMFWYQNPGVYVRTPSYLSQLLHQVLRVAQQKRDQLGENFPSDLFDTYDWDASGKLDFQEFSQCLINTGTEYSIYLYFDYFFMRDYFDLITGAESLLSRAKFNKMIVPLMNNYISYSYSLLPDIDMDTDYEEEEDVPEEEDYEPEPDYDEEEEEDVEEENDNGSEPDLEEQDYFEEQEEEDEEEEDSGLIDESNDGYEEWLAEHEEEEEEGDEEEEEDSGLIDESNDGYEEWLAEHEEEEEEGEEEEGSGDW